MLTHMIGNDVFKDGLHNYLIAFKYSNADQSDLWRYLQEASDKKNQTLNVKKVMDSWTLKEGFPLVTVIRDYNNTNRIRFAQQRFLLNSNEMDKETLIRTQYEVPVTYTTKSEQNWKPDTRLWLQKNANGSESYSEIQLNVPQDDWLIANLQEVGFYRVNYDEKNWQLLVDQLLSDPSKIHRINRVQILDDLFHLAENGLVNYRLALRALSYLRNEVDPLPFTSIGTLIQQVDRMLRRTESYVKWQNFILQIIQPAYGRFELKPITGDSYEDNKMQVSIGRLACVYNQKDCVDHSNQLFDEFMYSTNRNPASTNNIPPNVRSTVYCTAIHHATDSSGWDFLFKQYLNEQNAIERNAMLTGLACSREPWILVRYLQKMANSSGIRGQDAVTVFRAIADQNYGKEIAFNFLQSNWQRIYKVVHTVTQFGNMFKSFVSINSDFELDQVRTFHRTIGSKMNGNDRLFLQTIEQIQSNIEWMKRYYDDVAGFLDDFEKNSNP